MISLKAELDAAWIFSMLAWSRSLKITSQTEHDSGATPESPNWKNPFSTSIGVPALHDAGLGRNQAAPGADGQERVDEVAADILHRPAIDVGPQEACLRRLNAADDPGAARQAERAGLIGCRSHPIREIPGEHQRRRSGSCTMLPSVWAEPKAMICACGIETNIPVFTIGPVVMTSATGVPDDGRGG